MKEILLIDKPIGITSYDIIRKLRKKLNIRKIGHAGTLDPLASGLMILGIGKGTKKLNNYIKLDKVYKFETLLGIKTTTGDLEGEILKRVIVEDIDNKKVEKVIRSLAGKIELPVPSFSAIKQDGEPLYKKARRGEKVNTPIKTMNIYWIRLKNQENDNGKYVLSLEAKVSSGTYIRSISEEIGKRLGFPATTSKIRRTEIGDFKIKDAETI